MKKSALLLSVGVLATVSAQAQFLVSGTGANTLDFNTFAATGIVAAPVAGQLDSNIWRARPFNSEPGTIDFGGNYTSIDFTRGITTGGVGSGGIYAFELSSSDFAVGFQPTGSDFLPGTFTFRLTNDTGLTITDFSIDYDIIVRNDQPRASSFNFAHSGDDTAYTNVASANYTSPEAADVTPSFQTVSRSFTISGLNIGNGDNYFFQWQSNDVSGSGGRDELGLDNLVFSATTVVPEPSTYAAIAGVLVLGLAILRRRK